MTSITKSHENLSDPFGCITRQNLFVRPLIDGIAICWLKGATDTQLLTNRARLA